jgi:excisionase family DNA binding protein
MTSEPLALFAIDDMADSTAAEPTTPSGSAVPRLLLSPTEAAQALGIGRSKLYELMREDVVPSITIGACRRIVASDLPGVIERLRTAQIVGSAQEAVPE